MTKRRTHRGSRGRAALALAVSAFAAAVIPAACSSGGDGACPNDLPASCPSGASGYKASVAPLISELCMPCHAPGGQSVHYLQTYDEVYALRGAVLDQVYACKMPPPAQGYAPLTSDERQAILGWLVCGAPND